MSINKHSANKEHALMSLPLWNTPPTVGLSVKTSVNMAELSRENRETRRKTNDYLLKLKAAGLDSDSYNLPKHQRSMDTDS